MCVAGLPSETLCSLILEAEDGENVTFWCQHELTVTGYIFWLFQFLHPASLDTTSAPLLIGCKHFKTSGPPETCYFFTESKRAVFSVDGKKTSLTVSAVNVSDAGLYYCGFMKLNQISFSNSTYLSVKGKRIRYESHAFEVLFSSFIRWIKNVNVFQGETRRFIARSRTEHKVCQFFCSAASSHGVHV